MYSLKRFSEAITGWLRRDHQGEGRYALSIAAGLLVLAAVTAAASPPPFQRASGEYYYYSSGARLPLVLSEDEIVVRFRQGVDARRVLMSDPDVYVNEESGLDGRFRLEILNLKAPGPDAALDAIAHINSRQDVEFAAPVFFAGEIKTLLTDEICVKFRPDLSEAEITAIDDSYGTEILRRHTWAENSFTVRVTDRSPADALTVANSYYEDDRVIYAHPNFVTFDIQDVVPDDTYYSDSWNLDNTEQRGGTADADIDMPEGWDLAMGTGSEIVAILDGHGVDTSHPDFAGKTVLGYDAYDGDNDPSPGVSCEGHGTCCAGIACAATDNALGVSGVGWHVKLMGVRIGSDPDCDGSFMSTAEIKADGIATAVARGAAVLSNSYGTSASDVLHDAIVAATTNGRGGLGTVICASTGNGNSTPVGYPARYSEVIAVGATNWCDERKRPVDDDCNNHEYWWGSNYGPNIDVVAPGIATWTTDNPGGGGYNTGSTADGDAAGNYFKWFGGTSGACPHMAALAALVISVNSGLTAAQVQAYIQNGADDMVGLPGEDTAGWDQYMGWGRINVYETLMLIDQPNLIPYQYTGWDDKIVPRNTGDAAADDVPLPDSLYGNASTTYFNWCERNSSTVGCAAHADHFYLDDVYILNASWARFGPNTVGVVLNAYPQYVRGGLHTPSIFIDWDDRITEKNETDNTYSPQFAWTPYILANRTPVYRNVPPDRGVLSYPNSDGFQASYTWMTAVAMAPADVADDYDLRVHPAYSSATASFRGYYDYSSATAGYTDLIIANYFGGSSRKEDFGVFRYNTGGPGAGMYVERSDLIYAFSYEGTYGPYTMAPYRLVDLYAPYFTTAGDYTFEVEITSGTANLVLALYDYSTDYVDKYEYIDYSNVNGDGGGEKVNAALVVSQYYPLAVFKNGTGDIGKEVTYVVHVYKTPPNLQPYTPVGWDYPIVPRDRSGAAGGSAALTDSLTGAATETYINLSWWNAGPDTCGQHKTYLIRDGNTFLTTGYPHLDAGQWVYGINWGPYFFYSGRHTLTESVDHLDWVLESDEDDNIWEMQFAWTPDILSTGLPVPSDPPPDPGSGTYHNCQGYQYMGKWWNVIGMMPTVWDDDYDMGMHMPYAGSLEGFDELLERSFAPNGAIDFVVANGNNAAVGYEAVRDASVFIESASSLGAYFVEGDTNIGTYSAPRTIAGQSLSANDLLDVFEIWFPSTGGWTVELIPTGGDANVGISMYDYLAAYMDKYETLPGGYSNDGLGGAGEMFSVEIDTSGYYGLVVWKVNCADLPESLTYDLKVYETPGNLTYSTPAGWSYPMTPRSTGDASQYYAPISPSLPGNSNDTYVNISWCNEGPDTAGPHETHGYVDGDHIVGLRRVAPLGPQDTLFVRNLGPYNVRGGRHTMSMDIDVLDEVLEPNEDDNFWSRQYVWSPLELTAETPVTRSEPPEPGSGAHPNCDGYYFAKLHTYTSVIGMCPTGDEDFDLRLYDDYSGSESGFSMLLAASLMGSGQTEFVGVRYPYTNTGQYPAAVRSLPVKGSGGQSPEPADGPLQTGLVIHPVTSLGNVINNSYLPAERAATLGPNEILIVYDVELAAVAYDFHLVNDSGNADLAFAVMPINSHFYGRGDAALEVNAAGPGSDEFTLVNVGTPGWFEVIVFKTGYTEIGKTSSFRFRVGEHGVAGVWDQQPEVPPDFVIEQNRPNPFADFTTVVYGVPGAGAQVRLRVYDTAGRLVATLVDGFKQPGYHEATWDGTTNAGKAAASGVYFCRLDAGDRTLTRRMLILK